ncbi:MAG: nitroreductase/quinone reductase family protein [Actinomycetota bacterium]
MTDTKVDAPRLPPRWVIRAAWRIHRGLYRLTGGRFGLRRPRPDTYGLMRMTTVGRRSGRERPVMLAYLEDGDDIVTMAMNGWGAPEPAWWLNLQAERVVEVHLPDGHLRLIGRAAVGAEHDRLWDRWRAFDERLDGYSARRDHTTVVVLEPTPLPPRSDLGLDPDIAGTGVGRGQVVDHQDRRGELDVE